MEAAKSHRRQRKKKNGFQRGFLLSNTKKSAAPKASQRKKPSSKSLDKKRVSNELLAVETQKSPLDNSPFVVVTQDENDEPPHPTFDSHDTVDLPMHLLASRQQDNSDNEFRIEPISTTTHAQHNQHGSSPLIQEVTQINNDSFTTNMATRLHRPQSENSLSNESPANKPIIVEIKEEERCFHHTSPLPEVEAPIEISKTLKEPVEGLCSSLVLEHQSSEEDSLDIAPLQSALSQVLWNLERKASKSQKEQIARDFVEQHVKSVQAVLFVWDVILETCAKECQSVKEEKVPSVMLGISMLQNSSQSIAALVSCLVPTKEKRSRLLAMGGILLVQHWLQSLEKRQSDDTTKFDDTITPPLWGDLLELVLPRLVDLLLETPERKTVLSHHAAVLFYEILTMTSKVACQANNFHLFQSVWNKAAMLERVFKVHQSWLFRGVSCLGDARDYSLLTNSSVSPDASRKQCTLAVIADWMALVTQCQLHYQDLCLETQVIKRKESLLSVAQYLCEQLCGVENIGGLESVAMGGLAQSLGSDRHNKKIRPRDILSCFEAAVGLMKLAREDSHPQGIDQSSPLHEKQRAILRGVLAWLGQSKKHLRLLAETNALSTSRERSPQAADPTTTILQHAIQSSINLLRPSSKESINLVFAILNHLWSISDGLPPDCVDGPDAALSSNEVPTSFGLLMDELKSMTSSKADGDCSSDSAGLDPASRAICLLLSRCILRKGRKDLLDALVARNGLGDSSVEVLSTVLEAEKAKSCESENQDSPISHYAGRIVLDNLRSHPSVRKRICSSPDLLVCLQMEFTVPILIQTLADELNSTTRGAVNAVVGTTLTHIMEKNVQQIEQVISVLVDALLHVGSASDSHSEMSGEGTEGLPQSSTDPVSSICANFGGAWRRCLLEAPACGDFGLSQILVAIGRVMFSMPSNTVPLTLFGSIVGNGRDENDVPAAERRRIYYATRALLKLSIPELLTGCGPESATQSEASGKGDSRLFRQLSPLLLLRRLPSSYFHVSLHSLDTIFKDTDDGFIHLLGELSESLAFRLDAVDSMTSGEKTFTSEERRLSADIAGRCLPFYRSGETKKARPFPCCFRNICVPAFAGLYSELSDSSSRELDARSIRTAKAALFATCLAVPLANNSDEGEGILATAAFSLRVLTVAKKNDTIDEDLVLLQTGCIEFFAICLERWLHRSLQHSKNTSGDLVVEVSGSRVEKGVDESSVLSTGQAMKYITSAIVEILRTGNTHATWPHDCDKWFGGKEPLSNHNAPSFFPSARTCLWNSFIITSQRITEQEKELDVWASMNAPWILTWGTGGQVDDDLRHPLCTAAALQVVFVLITRTKSFDCLTPSKTNNKGVHEAYKWALECLKCKSRQGGDYATCTMRMAALKLMLAIVSVDQVVHAEESAWQGCLSPGELGESLSILRGAANMDPDPNVRQLAARILGAMQLVI